MTIQLMLIETKSNGNYRRNNTLLERGSFGRENAVVCSKTKKTGL